MFSGKSWLNTLVRSYPKTLGGKRIHVFVPLERGPNQKKAGDFVRRISKEMTSRSPEQRASAGRGIIPLYWTLDHAGPMAGTVADVALLLQEMSGSDSKDSSTVGQPTGNSSITLTDGLRGKRIGLPRSSYFAGSDLEVLQAIHTAVKLLEKLGASIEEVDLSPTGYYGVASSWTIAYT